MKKFPITSLKKKETYTSEELLQVGLVMFACLCEEGHSSDKMFLAFSSAKSRLENSNIKKEKLEFIMKKYIELAETSRQSNFLVKCGFYG